MKLFFLVFPLLFLLSCNSSSTIEIEETNLNPEKTYFFDYENAFQYGFIVPSKKTDHIESFNVSFNINRNEEDSLFYKIYYQNESYKFPEKVDSVQNIFAAENFYGSWPEPSIGFKSIVAADGPVTTDFIIQGNPRNEGIYFNENSRNREITDNDIEQLIIKIKNSPDWLESITTKAKNTGVPLEQQIREDASWMLSQNVNNRWQRNPRVGKYSLLIVVTNRKGLNAIPGYIKNISLKKEGAYINPYYYYLYGPGKDNPNINTLLVDNFVTLKASVPLKNGFYVPPSENFLSTEYFNDYVNSSPEQYKNASFTYHDTYRSDSIKNLPIKTDFFSDGFSIADYKTNQEKYDSTDRISTWLASAQHPGKTFGYDQKNDLIWFKNPGCKDGELRKEHVGFKTRHGLTYGTYTFKVKMSELLNQQQVWTGLTNAIWMLYDTYGKWNNRRICEGDGYYPYYVTPDSKKTPQTSYSEIDFEILKAAEFWPKWDYKDPEKKRVEPESHKDKIMVACTNWDLSCTQPKNFDVGVHQIAFKGDTFDLHRWHSYQNAVTSKVPELDDELFGSEYYYFQLEWNPTEIIWRIGPEKDNLHVVGYMDNTVTSIPNNQMITVFTQEYHYSHWWPNAPFLQEDIPFPSQDLPGKLFSIEIE